MSAIVLEVPVIVLTVAKHGSPRALSRTHELTLSAVLTAFALLIPLVFRGWLQVYIPPFSATIGAHVPVMLAMVVSPLAAALVGLGSALGFLLTLGPVIAARALAHVVFGVAGALFLRRGLAPAWVLLATAPIHALFEVLVVMPFGFSFEQAGLLVGVGTLLHHGADAAIALFLLKAIERSGVGWKAFHGL